MVLIHHFTIPGRVPARRAFSAAVGDAEQQPLVGFNSFLARSPAISCIPLAGLGAWSGQRRCHRPPVEHPQGCWDICEANGSLCTRWGSQNSAVSQMSHLYGPSAPEGISGVLSVGEGHHMAGKWDRVVT